MARRITESDKELFERFNAGLRKYLEDEQRKMLERNPRPIRKDDSIYPRRRPTAPLRFQNQPNQFQEQRKRFDEGLREYLESGGMRARSAKIQNPAVPKTTAPRLDEHMVKVREIRKKFDMQLLNHLQKGYPHVNSRVAEISEISPTDQLRRNLLKKYGDPRLNESSFSDFVKDLEKSLKPQLSTSINRLGNYSNADLSEISLAPKYFVPRDTRISTPRRGPKYSTSRISRKASRNLNLSSQNSYLNRTNQRRNLSEIPNMRLDEFFDIETNPALQRSVREQLRTKRFMEYNLPPMPSKLLKDLADFLNV